MADEKTEAKPTEAPADKPAGATADKPAEKGKGGSIVPWIIIAAVVVVTAVAGLVLGRLLAGAKPQAAAAAPAAPATNQPPAAEQLKPDKPGSAKEDAWYFDLEPVVANLDEPGATRYVRASLTLEMSPEISSEKGTTFLQQKKPLLTNLLTIYLAGLNIEATRGDKNLKRIQTDICDAFNEHLFPNNKPLIKRILIKEFAVQ
jgi:flagellar basal body-associated protein FliL